MITTEWKRTVQLGYSYPSGSVLLGSIVSGARLTRVRFSWGFYGDTSPDTSMFTVASNLHAFGLVTTVGDGTETPPDARTQSADQAPPTQRWIWWESRAPMVTAFGPGVVTWRDTPPQETVDTKGQVLATGIPDGQYLNLWASWALAYDWDSPDWFLWVAASILVTSS
jgi:hypothetical protein